MTLVALTPRDRRVLQIGAAAMLAILLFGRGLPWVLRWSAARRASADEAVQRSARAQLGVRNLESHRRSLVAVRAQLAAYDSALLAGSTPAIAGATLAQVISESASSAEVQLGPVQLGVDSTARGALGRVTARATLTGNLEAIALFLESLEEGHPLLAVRTLGIAQGQTGVPRSQRELLQAEVEVEGLFRKDGAERPR